MEISSCGTLVQEKAEVVFMRVEFEVGSHGIHPNDSPNDVSVEAGGGERG